MNDSILLGDIWKKIRKSKGYTQEYVAEKLDLGTRYVSDLERNKTLGSISTLIKLCNIYEVTSTIVLQEYLNIKEDLIIDTDLIGFYSLNEKQKELILKLINFIQE